MVGSALSTLHLVGGGHGVKADSSMASKPGRGVMRETCVVVGSGVVGLTTAYYLSRTGRYDSIHVIDERSDCALGASFQNGGVINVEAIAPLGSYMNIFSTLKNSLVSPLTGEPTNTHVTWRSLFEQPAVMATWFWYFLENRSEERILRNAGRMREIGRCTGPLFEETVADLGLDVKAHNFFHTPGLVLYKADDPDALVASKHSRFGSVLKKKYVTDGELSDIIDESGLPGLPHFGFNVGCVEPNNLTINTRSFCCSLRRRLEDQGVRFHFCAKVQEILVTDSSVRAVALSGGEILEADSFVLCAGCGTVSLLRKLGITLPLAAVKAYSLHISDYISAPRLRYAALLEDGVSCLITPYHDSDPPSVRVTGIRDLDGMNDVVREKRVSSLMGSAHRFLGEFDEKNVAVWAGVMAVSPDDFPIVGRLERFDNLYVNVGHGFRGTNWSLATAKLLSQHMVGVSDRCLPECAIAPCRFGV